MVMIRDDVDLGALGFDISPILNIAQTGAQIYAQREAAEAQEDALKAQQKALEMQKQIELIRAQTAATQAVVATSSTGQKDNTMLYVGIGVVALGAVAFFMLKK